MIALIISTICGALYSVFFKLFLLKGVDKNQAIIFNYLTAFTLGCTLSVKFDGSAPMVNPLDMPQFIPAIGMGLFFFLGMIFMSESTKRVGVSVSTICSRASMIIPIVICFLFVPDTPQPKWIPLTLIFLAIFLIIFDGKVKTDTNKNGVANILMPALVFFSFGTCSSCIKLMQNSVSMANANSSSDVINQNISVLSALIFFSALIFAILNYVFLPKEKKSRFRLKSVLGGMALGASNFFCTYLLMLAMKNLNISFLYPFHNIFIILIGTIIGWLAFGERLKVKQVIGMLIALVSIWWISA